jgi:hypothetical protein
MAVVRNLSRGINTINVGQSCFLRASVPAVRCRDWRPRWIHRQLRRAADDPPEVGAKSGAKLLIMHLKAAADTYSRVFDLGAAKWESEKSLIECVPHLISTPSHAGKRGTAEIENPIYMQERKLDFSNKICLPHSCAMWNSRQQNFDQLGIFPTLLSH